MTLNGYRHTPSPDFLMRKTDREKTEGIAEYVVNHGKFSFSDVPFGPADSLVFSILSYLTPEAVFPDFDGRQKMPLKRLAQLYERHYVPPKHPGRFSMEARAPELLYRLAVSARFSEIAVTDYESYLDEEKESQFAAMTFSAQNGSIYITYRGTDDHIIGWKEDFNMSCCDSVPSQKRALLYLKQQAEREETERIFLGGHSKGGNLAVYAAAFADRAVQRKIAGIHSFDSPGFSERFFSYPGYRSISGRIINFMRRIPWWEGYLSTGRRSVLSGAGHGGFCSTYLFTGVFPAAILSIPVPSEGAAECLRKRCETGFPDRMMRKKRCLSTLCSIC